MISPVQRGAKRGWHYERLNIITWAEKKVTLPGSMTATDGPLRLSNAPWEAEPLQEIANDQNESVVLIKANQVGGTTIGVVSMAYFADQDPASTMWCTGNQDLARDFSKDTLFKIFRNISTLDEKVLNDRRTASTFEIRLPAMTLLLAWGGSENKAEQKSVRYLYLDEFEKYPELIGHFEKRTTRFHNSRKIFISAPGETVGPAWQMYLTTDMREWHFPCLSCEAMLPLKFRDHVFFDRFYHATGRPDWARIFPTIRYICPSCKHEHFESSALHLHIQNPERSKWIALAPNANDGMKRRNIGFRWNAMILPLIEGIPSWEKIVKEFIEADIALKEGTVQHLIIWSNKRMAEGWTPGQEYEKKESVLASYKIEDALRDEWTFKFLKVDVQHLGFWHVARGWRKEDGFSRLLSEGELKTWGDIEAKAQALGITNPHHVFVDARYNPGEVHRQCAKYGWTALLGEERKSFPHHSVDRNGKRKTVWRIYSEPRRIDCGIGTEGQGRIFCVEFLFANPTAQDILQRHINGEAASKWEVPQDVSAEYLKQRDGARYVNERNKKTGVLGWFWKQVGPEHMRDCEKMGIVAASMAKCIHVDVGEDKQDERQDKG